MHPRDILKSTPFFADVLTDDEIDMLAARARFIAFPEGAVPMEEDAPGTSMFVIAKGKVGVTVAEDASPLATLGPGDIIGEMSLLTGARRSATVTALEPVEVLEVNKEALAHVLSMSPTLVGRFVDMLIRRQRMLDRIAGGGAWGMVRPSRDELAALIARFFAAHGG
jgi:CRP/FNR family cyclic AMP-dependent transcriptional regulator